MENFVDENMVNEFISESRDNLETIEPDLLELERDGKDVPPEVINRLFRAMHSIKGASSFFGFDAITRLTHAMESVFMKFRDRELVPDRLKIDVLLAGVDMVRTMLIDVNECDNIRHDKQLAAINSLLNGKSPAGSSSKNQVLLCRKVMTTAKVIPVVEKLKNDLYSIFVQGPADLGDAHFSLSSAQMAAIHENPSRLLYLAWVQKKHEFIEDYWSPEDFHSEINTIGQLFYSELAQLKEGTYTHDYYPVLFGTIIKPDLIAYSLKIPEHRVKTINPAFFDLSRWSNSQKANESVVSAPPLRDNTAIKTQNLTPSSMAETIRVNVELIDRLMNLAGELVLGRNQLRKELDHHIGENPKLSTIIQTVDMVTSNIQQDIIQMRMQPIGNLLNKFTRIVRDLSHQLNKKASLFITGNDVELDKSLLEGLSDPLTHLIRNCMDHGIELPLKRKRKGKPETGRIEIRAYHKGGQINVVVSDDGQGISPEDLVEKAIQNGLINRDRAAVMNEREKISLVLLPGLSTAEKITNISGRGVGMDVVKTNIEKLGGSIEINSRTEIGTTIHIRLPLTLTIIPSLIVGDSDQYFAIPQVSIKELVWIKAADVGHRIEKIGDAPVLLLREKLVPLVRLSDVLGLQGFFKHPNTKKLLADHRERLTERRKDFNIDRGQYQKVFHGRNEHDRRQNWRGDINVVVLRMRSHLFGLVVDELVNNEEIVVKPLSKHIQNAKCFSGSTIMGDGKVAMILDAGGIVQFSGLKFSEIENREVAPFKKSGTEENISSEDESPFIVFINGREEYFALPMAHISRLEKIKTTDIYKLGDRSFMNFRGESLPLVYLAELIQAKDIPADQESVFVIIPKLSNLSAGIVVSEILDTVEKTMDVKKDHMRVRGISGHAFMENRLVRFLNADDLPELINHVMKINLINAA